MFDCQPKKKTKKLSDNCYQCKIGAIDAAAIRQPMDVDDVIIIIVVVVRIVQFVPTVAVVVVRRPPRVSRRYTVRCMSLFDDCLLPCMLFLMLVFIADVRTRRMGQSTPARNARGSLLRRFDYYYSLLSTTKLMNRPYRTFFAVANDRLCRRSAMCDERTASRVTRWYHSIVVVFDIGGCSFSSIILSLL